MVEGLDRFADHFAGFTDQYALIGGAACDLAMQAAAQTFRVTKDLDIVLCLESLSGDFVESFWRFVRDRVYQKMVTSAPPACRSRSAFIGTDAQYLEQLRRAFESVAA